MHQAAAFAPSHRSPMPSGMPAVALASASAALPLVLFGLGQLGVRLPFARWLVPAVALATVVLVLVWLHRTFTALRGRTRYSPGMAVAGWFIPVANLFLPALVFRDAWRASIGHGGGVAFLWMIAWWLTTAVSILRGLELGFSAVEGGPVHVLLLGQSRFEIPGMTIDTVGTIYQLVSVAVTVAAYGLLALMVHRISRGPA